MKTMTRQRIDLGGRRVDYFLVRSSTARKLRVRIGLNGLEVVQPAARQGEDVGAFLHSNGPWILDQLRRVERLRAIRQRQRLKAGEFLFRGQPTPVRVESEQARRGSNKVVHEDGQIIVRRGIGSRTPAHRSLENWLREQARQDITVHLEGIARRLKVAPGKVYVMGQRTKWGNCSARRNLSFNWRLVLAPEFVLRYIVTHEAVHLTVPDHSAKFWLTVQSLCQDSERSKQWLSANGRELVVNLEDVCR